MVPYHHNATPRGLVQYCVCNHPPPPAGYPDLNFAKIFSGFKGLSSVAGARTLGLVVNVLFDADHGSLTFSMSFDLSPFPPVEASSPSEL